MVLNNGGHRSPSLFLPTQEAVAVSPGWWSARALYGALVAVEGVGAQEQLPPAPRHQGG